MIAAPPSLQYTRQLIIINLYFKNSLYCNFQKNQIITSIISRASWWGIFRNSRSPAVIIYNKIWEDLFWFCLIKRTPITISFQLIYLITNFVDFYSKFCCWFVYPVLSSYQKTCLIIVIFVKESVTLDT